MVAAQLDNTSSLAGWLTSSSHLLFTAGVVLFVPVFGRDFEHHTTVSQSKGLKSRNPES